MLIPTFPLYSGPHSCNSLLYFTTLLLSIHPNVAIHLLFLLVLLIMLIPTVLLYYFTTLLLYYFTTLQLIKTLRFIEYNILLFLLVLIIMFVGFFVAGHLMFGDKLQEYATFAMSE